MARLHTILMKEVHISISEIREVSAIAACSHVFRRAFGSSAARLLDTMCSMTEKTQSEYDGHKIWGAPPDRPPRQDLDVSAVLG